MPMSLDRDTLKQLVDLLVPHCKTPDDQEALFTLALGLRHPLLKQIQYSNNPQTFAIRMIGQLDEFGEVEPGKTALWLLLEEISSRVGEDVKVRIDIIQKKLNPTSRSEEANVPAASIVPVLTSIVSPVLSANNLRSRDLEIALEPVMDFLNPHPPLPRKRGEGEKHGLLSLSPLAWERDSLRSKQGEGKTVVLKSITRSREARGGSRKTRLDVSHILGREDSEFES
jgi:hypothetical protein